MMSQRKSRIGEQNSPESLDSRDSKKHILVVDDDPEILSLLNDFLQAKGYEVLPFSDSKKALASLKTLAVQKQVGVVISDMSMPNLNGLQLLKEIREIPLEIPLILITAFGSRISEIEAKNRGVFAFLPKPFKLIEITNSIDIALNAV